MFELAILAIFKNEALVIDEWINHYLREGVQHFFLIDNGSTDNSREKLAPYNQYITLFADSEPSAMTKLFNRYFIPQKSRVRWLAVVDFDEFLYGKRGITIRDYVRTLTSDIGQVVTPFSFYGSSGLIKQPDLIVPNFLLRWNNERRNPMETKGIVNCTRLISLDLHSHPTTGRNISCDGKDVPQHPLTIVTPHLIEHAALQLNHYVLQSLEWFQNVKMKRPDGNSSANNNDRNEEFFARHDHNDVHDDELSTKTYSPNKTYTPDLSPVFKIAPKRRRPRRITTPRLLWGIGGGGISRSKKRYRRLRTPFRFNLAVLLERRRRLRNRRL